MPSGILDTMLGQGGGNPQRAAVDSQTSIIERGAAALEAIGTPEAMQAAQLFRSNPAGMSRHLQQSGGWGPVFQALNARAAEQRVQQQTNQLIQRHVGGDQPFDERGLYSEMLQLTGDPELSAATTESVGKLYPQELMNVGPGTAVYDPQTRSEVYRNPAAGKLDKGAVLKQNLQDGLLTIDEFTDRWDAINKGGVNVTVNTAKANERRSSARMTVSKIGGLLSDMETIPRGSVGARGAVAKWIGGVVGNFSPDAAQSMTNYFTGGDIDRGELADFQTRLKTYATSLISIVTGEKTGRISEPERKMAFDTAGVIGVSNDYVAVRGAMNALARMYIVNEEIIRSESGEGQQYAVGNREETLRSAALLRRQGFPSDVIEAILGRLIQEFPGNQPTAENPGG